jgi:tetratricopeptide (TPR) repeat protein
VRSNDVSGRRPRGHRDRRIALAALVVAIAVLALAGCSDPIGDAEALAASGDTEGAEAIYQEVLASDSENLEAMSGLAVVLELQGKFDEALPLQERVVEAEPTDVQTRIELGFNYLNHQNRSDEAVRVLEQAVDLDGTPKNMTFLAQAQAAAGDAEGAERTLRSAIELDPNYTYSYTVLIDLLQESQRDVDAAKVRDLAASRGVSIETTQPPG